MLRSQRIHLTGAWIAAALVHAAVGIVLAQIMWFPGAAWEGARERLLWGFPGPILMIAPLVTVVGGVRRWRRSVGIADLGIAFAAGVALAQDVIREKLDLAAAPPLTRDQAIALCVILLLSIVGAIVLHRQSPSTVSVIGET